MKKILLLAAGIFMTGLTPLTAQVRGFRDVLIGPTIGFGDSWVNKLSGTEKIMPTGYAGINVMAFSSQYFAWGGSLTYSSEGYRLMDKGTKETVMSQYIRMPLQGYFFMGDRYSTIRPYIHFGPSFAVLVTQIGTATNSNTEIKPATPLMFNNYDVGLNTGGGVNMKLGRLTSLNLGMDYYKSVIGVIDDHNANTNLSHNIDITAALLVRISR